MSLPPGIETQIEAIAQDRLSGARKLAQEGSQALLSLAEGSGAANLEVFKEEVKAVGRALISAQPSMAPLVNLANEALFSMEGASSLEEARGKVGAASIEYSRALERSGTRIARQALPLIGQGPIMTHSFSSTVLEALLLAKREGRIFEVICTESRPQGEGRLLAERLNQEGISVKLVVDGLAPATVRGVRTVLVGADALSSEGLVNKAGTYALALAARSQKIPFYALCGREKFLPTGYELPGEKPREPQEVWPHHPEGVEVLNLYFDLTPLHHLSGVVSEEGVWVPSKVLARLKRLRLHPALVG